MQIEAINQSYSSEIACVVLCCRVFIKSAKAEELERFVVLHEIDWNEVYKLSALQRIRPVVYHVLVNHKIPVPASNLSQFYNYCRVHSAFAFERRMESARIQQLLLQHQIPARMYKGLDFTITAYGGDIAMREFTDIDMIVDQQHLPALAAVMIAEGYTSKQLNYFNRFPAHFVEGRKDICFEKRQANGRLFCFEFHYKPTGYLVDLPLAFSDVLGPDYLSSAQPISRQQYYELMLINHGASDYYPNLRSLIDMVLLARDESWQIPAVLQRHEQLGNILIDRLLKGSLVDGRNKCADVLAEQLLTSTALGFNKIAAMRIRFLKSPRTLLKALHFLLLPNEEDINRTRWPYFQLYYFVKPFRLLKKHFRALIGGKAMAGGN